MICAWTEAHSRAVFRQPAESASQRNGCPLGDVAGARQEPDNRASEKTYDPTGESREERAGTKEAAPGAIVGPIRDPKDECTGDEPADGALGSVVLFSRGAHLDFELVELACAKSSDHIFPVTRSALKPQPYGQRVTSSLT